MKSFVTFFTAAVLLTACGADKESPKPDSPPKTVNPTKPVAELTPIERGAKIYKRCRACHTLEDGGKNKVGPNLWNVYGAKSATKEGFNYSKAMRAADLVWTEETIDAYLERPAAFMPGNTMSFIGLKKQEDRDAVQAYLKAKTTPKDK